MSPHFFNVFSVVGNNYGTACSVSYPQEQHGVVSQRPDRGYSEAIMARVLCRTQRCDIDKSLTPRILCLSIASNCVRSEACCYIGSVREVIRIMLIWG